MLFSLENLPGAIKWCLPKSGFSHFDSRQLEAVVRVFPGCLGPWLLPGCLRPAPSDSWVYTDRCPLHTRGRGYKDGHAPSSFQSYPHTWPPKDHSQTSGSRGLTEGIADSERRNYSMEEDA